MLLDRPVTSLDLSPEVIEPSPFQARQHFSEEELLELAESLHLQGMLSRIRVRPHPDREGCYQLIYGERRLRAAKLLDWPTVPCETAEYTDEELIEIGLTENLQRANLEPLEEAKLFRYLLDRPGTLYSIRTLADRLSKHKNYIEERLALLRLPDDVRQILEEQPNVSLRALIELAKIPTQHARQPLVEQLRHGLMSTEDIRTIVQEVLLLLKTPTPHSEPVDANTPTFQRVLNKASQRMHSALTQLKTLASIYQTDPDPSKKDLLKEYIENARCEIKQVEEML